MSKKQYNRRTKRHRYHIGGSSGSSPSVIYLPSSSSNSHSYSSLISHQYPSHNQNYNNSKTSSNRWKSSSTKRSTKRLAVSQGKTSNLSYIYLPRRNRNKHQSTDPYNYIKSTTTTSEKKSILTKPLNQLQSLNQSQPINLNLLRKFKRPIIKGRTYSDLFK